MQEIGASSNLNRRLTYLSIFIILIGGLFVFRLFWRQVVEHETFASQAQRQYYTKIDQPARRGEVFIKDRDSQDLVDESKTGLFAVATDLELYNVMVVPKNIKDKEGVAKSLAPILAIDEKEIFDKINNDKLYIPALKKKISKEDADKITALKVDAITLEGEYCRFYPENQFLSSVLGFVDSSGNGRYGLEEKYDGVLKGEGGQVEGLKDNLGRILSVDQSEPGKDGSSVVLTIDRSIQYMAEKKLKEGIDRYKAVGGSIIIMDPKDGSILAMASTPSFDPNKYNEVKSEDQAIFLNPATSLNWEPGSIFKPITVAAALEDKKIEPDSKPDEIPGGFKNMVTVDGYDIHNSQDKSLGYETVTQILENSDNVGMVWIADKLGNDIFYDYLRKFGFGAKTGIDLAGESSGQLAIAKKWKNVNRATISFGQGISVTPIQIIQAYGAIANNGKMVKPHILDSVIQSDGSRKQVDIPKPEQIISEETSKKDKEMLVSVVENGHGKKAKVEGFRVGGKTGTAQVPKQGGGYEEGAHIGSFAGFAPVDDPRFVMLVKFDRPQTVEWAESSAAPIFGEIADWLLNSYLKVPKQQT